MIDTCYWITEWLCLQGGLTMTSLRESSNRITHNLISHLPLQFSDYISTFYFAGFELGETFCNTHSIGADLIIIKVSVLY